MKLVLEKMSTEYLVAVVRIAQGTNRINLCITIDICTVFWLKQGVLPNPLTELQQVSYKIKMN